MAQYQYTHATADVGGLCADLMAVPLPVDLVRGPDGAGIVIVFTTRDLTGPEEATLAATVAAHDPVASAANNRRKTAKTLAAAQEAPYHLTRAIAVAAGLDGDNPIRKWVTDFVAQVALATSLANLQTRVAALGGLAPVTAANVKQKVLDRLDGSAD